MKVRLAVIGSGFGLYGLLPAFQKISDCEIVGICGKNSERLVNYCKKTAVPAIFQDWRELIEKVKPDAIAVAVIPKYQCEILKDALNKGISVFAEKPLAVHLEQAQELLAAARQSGKANMVDFIFPEIPQWIQTKKLLDENTIGKVNHLSVNWSFLSHDIKNQIKTWKSDPQEGGGALSFYFSHFFYNLEFFLGKIQNIWCDLNHSPHSIGEGESIVNMILRFESGATGNIVLNCGSMGIHRHVWEFQGEKGDLVLQNLTRSVVFGFKIICFYPNGEKQDFTLPEALISHSGEDERVVLVKSLGERFIAWHQQGKVSKPDFEDAFRVQQLITLAGKSL